MEKDELPNDGWKARKERGREGGREKEIPLAFLPRSVENSTTVCTFILLPPSPQYFTVVQAHPGSGLT
jgi:hypothetical protein